MKQVVKIKDITNDELIVLMHDDIFGIHLDQYSSMSYKIESELEQIINEGIDTDKFIIYRLYVSLNNSGFKNFLDTLICRTSDGTFFSFSGNSKIITNYIFTYGN
jgi:hypothetical protein